MKKKQKRWRKKQQPDTSADKNFRRREWWFNHQASEHLEAIAAEARQEQA